jgi:hypothetical protein
MTRRNPYAGRRSGEGPPAGQASASESDRALGQYAPGPDVLLRPVTPARDGPGKAGSPGGPGGDEDTGGAGGDEDAGGEGDVYVPL